MNQKRSKQSKLAKQTLKCQCCLKTIENDYQAVEITNKIARQFQKFTNLELTTKDSAYKICLACKKELKYISNLRSDIVKKNKSSSANLDVSSFTNFFASITSETCRICSVDKKLKSVSSKVSLQFEEFTEIKLSESDKLCLLCQNELNYFARVRKDLQEIHLKQEINLHVDETANMSCYYCIKPFKDDEKMFGLNDKLASQFKDFTGIDMSYDEHIMKICVCCKRKLKFVVNLKKSLVNNLSNISPTNCQCCSKEFEMDVKCIAVTEEIESQFYKLTHEKLLKFSSICRVCKLKLDYVEVLQSNLQDNQKIMDGYVAPVEVIKNVVAVATVKKTKDIIHVASVEEESKYKLIVKKRRIIDYKSSVEEPKVEKETKFNCIHCEKGFDQLPLLNKHVNYRHNDLNPMKCTKCKIWYKVKIVDQNGISISEKRVKKYVCDLCVKNQLKEFGVVEKKIRGPRNGTRIPEIKSIKISKCDVCSIIVKTTAALDEHKVHMHSDDRRFPCLQCTTAFKTKSDLTKHVRRVHELQRNAKCPLCIKTFFGSEGVKLHIQQFHSDERNYKCEGYGNCEKAFKNKYKLDEHIRYLHLQERNFPCSVCGLAFFTAAFARNHQKKIHDSMI